MSARRLLNTSEEDERATRAVRVRARSARPVQERADRKYGAAGSVRENRPEAAAEMGRFALAAPQPCDQHAAQRCVARRNRRRTAPPIADDHHDLREVRHRGAALDHTPMAGWR